MTRAIGLVLAVGLALAAATGTVAAKGSADLQWAQQVLKDKGFDVGKPNGEMTPKTRAALSSFQRISNLAVTGELDAATTAKLLAGRPDPSGGAQLGLPKPGHAQPVHDAMPAKPHAAPSARVEALGGPAGEAVIGSAGGVASSGSSGGAPAPRAAPSGAVSAATTGVLPGQPAQAVKENGDTQGPLLIEAAGWVRTLVIGVIVAVFGGFAFLWWLSGRKPSHRRPVRGREHHGYEDRVEPSFASPPQRGGRELRVRRL